MQKSIYRFIINLIGSVFFVFSVFFTDDKFIKTVSLIILLILINLESIKKLWLKYKTKRDKHKK